MHAVYVYVHMHIQEGIYKYEHLIIDHFVKM